MAVSPRAARARSAFEHVDADGSDILHGLADSREVEFGCVRDFRVRGQAADYSIMLVSDRAVVAVFFHPPAARPFKVFSDLFELAADFQYGAAVVGAAGPAIVSL